MRVPLLSAQSLVLVLGTRPSKKRKEDLGNRLGRKCTTRLECGAVIALANLIQTVSSLISRYRLSDVYKIHTARLIMKVGDITECTLPPTLFLPGPFFCYSEGLVPETNLVKA